MQSCFVTNKRAGHRVKCRGRPRPLVSSLIRGGVSNEAVDMVQTSISGATGLRNHVYALFWQIFQAIWAISEPQNGQIWSKMRILGHFWILTSGLFASLSQFFALKINVTESWHDVEHILLIIGAKIWVLNFLPFL